MILDMTEVIDARISSSIAQKWYRELKRSKVETQAK